MGYVTKNGLKAKVYSVARGTVVNTAVALTVNAWYEVLSRGAVGTTALPVGFEETSVFKTPDTGGTAITLASGDAVYPLTLTEICKTDASIECEEGVVEVTDDCESGYNASILDGYADIKGTLGGFFKVDDDTGVIKSDTLTFLKKFFDYATDDGDGNYVLTAKSNEKFLLMVCLNKDALATDKQNWLIIPVIISGMSMGAGLKDAQKRDLTWTKAQGLAGIYARTAFAGDLIS
jgi:hypothetical protein